MAVDAQMEEASDHHKEAKEEDLNHQSTNNDVLTQADGGLCLLGHDACA